MFMPLRQLITYTICFDGNLAAFDHALAVSCYIILTPLALKTYHELAMLTLMHSAFDRTWSSSWLACLWVDFAFLFEVVDAYLAAVSICLAVFSL